MKKILTSLTILFMQHTLVAQTVTIYRSGTPLAPTYSTLKAALTNTLSGDEVRMSAHTFNEYRDSIIGKHIIIKGTISGADTTTLDGKGLGPVIIYANPGAIKDSLVLQDLIITGGNNPVTVATVYTGGGIAAWGILALVGNVIVRDNISGGSGGGISNLGPTYLFGGEGAGLSTIKIYNNKLSYPIGRGGGIYSSQTNLFIYGNVQIKNNQAYTGAGIYAYRASVNTIIIDAKSGKIEISNNKADEIGGGIYFTAPAMPSGSIGNGVLVKGNVIIDGNIAKAKGGGVANADSVRYVGPGIEITNNHSDEGGGGIYGYLKSSGGFTILDNVLISGNTTNLKGGGVYVDFNHKLQASNSQIINNQANGGAAAIHIVNNASVNNCRIFNPTSVGKRQVEVQNNLIFSSSQCWWGESDTTGLIVHNPIFPSASFNLTNWVVATWSINSGSPVGTASTYPITANFTFNNGAALPAASFSMLQGKYYAPSGSFSPATAAITPANKISSTYTRPASGISNLLAVVDADSFKSNSNGLSVQSIGKEKTAVKAYPNPSKNVVRLEGVTQLFAATLYDLQGRIISTSNIDQNNNQIDLASVANGTYILQLKSENDIVQQFKIVKE